VSPAKRGIERIGTERRIISNGVKVEREDVSAMKLLGIIDELNSDFKP
jgi:hypothetical protein